MNNKFSLLFNIHHNDRMQTFWTRLHASGFHVFCFPRVNSDFTDLVQVQILRK